MVMPAIVLAQLAGTSLWFGANAVLGDLQSELMLSPAQVAALLSAVNAGFIVGTLCYALLMIADRFSPRLVFVVSAILAAAVNLLALIPDLGVYGLLVSRLGVGFFLAGIYPVGMKIAASWARGGLGSVLGFLVAALVLGTSMPHAVAAYGAHLPWRETLITLSVIALFGGAIIALLVPDGPYLKRSGPVKLNVLSAIWSDPKVRASAFGYFGHMFELYALYAAVPLIIGTYLHTSMTPGVSLLSAITIAVGALGCAIGGMLALKFGSARVAFVQLLISGFCCLLTPFAFDAPWWLFGLWLLVWGVTVSGDSPQFSALTAANSPPDAVGSILALVNSIGFAISVMSIAATSWAMSLYGPQWVLPVLAAGPILGLVSMRRLLRSGVN